MKKFYFIFIAFIILAPLPTFATSWTMTWDGSTAQYNASPANLDLGTARTYFYCPNPTTFENPAGGNYGITGPATTTLPGGFVQNSGFARNYDVETTSTYAGEYTVTPFSPTNVSFIQGLVNQANTAHIMCGNSFVISTVLIPPPSTKKRKVLLIQ